MASAADRLKFILEVDPTGAVKGFQSIGNAAEKELGKAESKLDKVGASMTKFGAGAMAFAGVAFTGLKKLADGAAELEANTAALNQVLGETLAANIGEWAKDGAVQVGLSERKILDAAKSFGSLGKVAGYAGDELETFTKRQVTLAADMAAFADVSPEQTIQDLRAAYAGSSETLQKYNVFVNDANIKQAILAATGEKVTGVLTSKQRIMGIDLLLMEQTVDMQGQWSRESDGLAGQQAQLAANMQNLADNIGQGVLPMFTEIIGGVNSVVGAFSSLSPEVKAGVGTFAGLATAALGAAGALSFTAGQFIKHRERFQTLFTTVDNGTRSLTLMGKAMTLAGGVATGAIAVYSLYASAKAKATARTNDLVSALKLEGDAQKQALLEIAKGDKVTRGALDALTDLGFGVQDLNQFVESGTGKFAKFIELVNEYGGYNPLLESDTSAFTAAVRDLGIEFDGSATSMVDLVRISEALRTDFLDTEAAAKVVAAATGESTDATNDFTTANEEAQDPLQAMIDRLEEEARAAEEAENALRDLVDAKRDAFDATYAVEKAQWALDDSMAEYYGTLLDGEATERDRAEALGRATQDAADLAEEIADAANAISIANGEGALSAVEMASIQVTQLDRIASQLDPDDPLRAGLMALRDELMEIPGVRSTFIYVDAESAKAELARVTELMNGIPRIGEITIPGFATGTAFAPGGVALVGERGPELVELPTGARVHTAERTRAMVGRSGGAATASGGSVTINVTALDPQQAADAVIDAIQQYERRNGPGWRR